SVATSSPCSIFSVYSPPVFSSTASPAFSMPPSTASECSAARSLALSKMPIFVLLTSVRPLAAASTGADTTHSVRGPRISPGRDVQVGIRTPAPDGGQANQMPMLVRREKLDGKMTEPVTTFDVDYDGEQLDLADRLSLRRVAGMSTELVDITEV